MKLFLLALLVSTFTFSKEKIVYKYKQYEKFDLGDMEIKGEIIAPGDLTVKERNNKFFTNELFNRLNYSKEIINEIKYMR